MIMSDVLGPKYRIAKDSFSIQYMRKKGFSEMTEPHTHTFYEIYYLRKGERIYFINGKLYTVKSGDLIVINPQDVHRTTSSSVEKFERILINFKEDFILPKTLSCDLPFLPFSEGSQLIRFPAKDQANIEKLIFQMLYECQKKEVGYIPYVQLLLSKLLIQIYRQSLHSPPIVDTPMSRRIEEITTYLNEHFHEKLTLNQVADQFFVSPSYLSRTFKKFTGFNFSEYVQAIRMREARRLLIESNQKVIEIAEKVGYPTIAHFNKTFRKHTGFSPTQFRKHHKHLSYHPRNQSIPR